MPFLFSALALDTARRSRGFFRRYHTPIQVAAGVTLVAMGLLVISGELFRLNIAVQQAPDRFGLNFFQQV